MRAELTCVEISRIEAVSCSDADATVCAFASACVDAVATVWLFSLTASADFAMWPASPDICSVRCETASTALRVSRSTVSAIACSAACFSASDARRLASCCCAQLLGLDALAAEDVDGLGHRADLVLAAGRRNLDVHLAGGQLLHHVGHARDRAHHAVADGDDAADDGHEHDAAPPTR